MQKETLTFFVKRVFVVLFFCAIQLSAVGQNTDFYSISTTNGTLRVNETPKNELSIRKETPYFGKYFRLVQFYSLPTDDERKLWEQQGLVLTDYLSGNTYYAVIDEGFNLSILQTKIRAVFAVDPGFKLESTLQTSGIPDHAKKGDKVLLTLSYYKTLNAAQVIADLNAKNGVVTAHREYSYQIDVEVPESIFTDVVNLPYIQFVGAIPAPIIKESNYSHRNSTARSNYLNSGYNGLNYNGSGVVIAIGEDGLLSSLIDVKGRTQEVGTSTVIQSHKVGCAQNSGGAGNEDPTDRNNAWGATILSADGGPNYASLYNSHNLRFTNHSYGFAISGGYDSSARNHDLRIVTYPNHLVSYSSGNSGTDVGYAPYNFAGWSNITGQVKQNKNHVAIGALTVDDQVTSFSSRGPMYDGRIIPQLVVEGEEGTSFASPKFVGELAQITQVYKTKNGGAEPASSLLRAVMMNTADDLGNPGPDHIHGYGRPNLRRAYHTLNENRYWTTTISNGQTKTQSITVPANTKQVRVMIVWPDVAAAVNANPAIVNNLNLSLKDPSNTNYNPWILDTTPNVANLSLPATRGVDGINTIEQVTVDNPQAGNWTVEVSGASVPFGPQTYYIVYEFLSDELTFSYPLYNEKLISGDNYYLRWDSYGETGTFNLAYELNNSGNWVAITSGYDANKRNFQWIAPHVNGVASIKFRVQRNGLTSYSEVNYIGSVPTNFRVFKSCADEVTLKWSPVNGATQYKVYRLGAQYMEEVTSNITFSGSTAVLTGQSTTANEYYALSAVSGVSEGQRCLTITKLPGDSNCAGLSWTGTISTDWFTGDNWASGLVPTASDNVVIPASAPNQPLINQVGAICAGITIDSGATLSMSNSTAYTLSVSGDWINNGSFSSGIGTVEFNNTLAYQEIGGNSTTSFYNLKVTKGLVDTILEATSQIALTGPTNPLTLTSGTFKLSSNSTITPFTSSTSIGTNMGLWINGGVVNSGNFSWFNNSGLIRISGGTFNFGTASNNTITYLNSGKFIIEGGTFNVAGRISPNSVTSSGIYQQNGGNVNVGLFGSTSTTRGLFEMTVNCTYQVTGGTITLVRQSSNSNDFINLATNNVVSGGTITFGNSTTPGGQLFKINSNVPLFDLGINSTNTPSLQLNSNLTVLNTVTNNGIVNPTTFTMITKGNWVNNGVVNPGSSTLEFSGQLPQSILGTAPLTTKNFRLNNANGVSLDSNQNLSVDGVLELTNGLLITGTNKVVMTANGSVNRTSGHIFGQLSKVVSSTSSSPLFEIGGSTISSYSPVAITFNTVTTNGALTVSSNEGDSNFIGTSSLIANKSVNQNWVLVNNGIGFSSYQGTFTYPSLALDNGANPLMMQAGLYNGSTWSYPSVGNRTATTLELTGLATFGVIQLAENCTDTSSSETITACGNYTWSINGQNYTTSGIYTHSVPLGNGCNHVYTLNLTLDPLTTNGSESITTCSNYTWPLNGQTYTSSGIYTYTVGCNTATLNLTVTPSTTNTSTVTACNSYEWSVNGQIYTTSGTYTHQVGCINEELVLTILPLQTYYADTDNDGFGNASSSIQACVMPIGYVTNNTDCEDMSAHVYPGAIDICYDGIDNDCNGNIDNIGLPGGCIPIYTVPAPAIPNSTIAYGATVLTSLVPNAQGYRYRVTRVNPVDNTPISATVTVDMGLRNLFLSNLSIYAYGAKFQVETTVRINNVWQPNYAPAFYVFSPTPVSTFTSCGTQIASTATQVLSSSVPLVNAYRYQVQRLDENNNVVSTQEITSGLRYFSFTQVTDLRYDANYRVSCAIRNLDGVFMAYGPACTIQAPKHPTTELRPTQCNDYAVLNNNEFIYANLVRNVLQYRYRLFNVDQGYDFSVDRNANYFRLSDFPGLTPGETYSVQVAVLMPGQPDFGPFSKTCTIIVPGIARSLEDVVAASPTGFEAVAYPNPFAENVYFKVSSSSTAAYRIQVYDMLGKLVESKTVSADSIESTEVGANFPAGVYNVIVTQGENTKALRIVKR